MTQQELLLDFKHRAETAKVKVRNTTIEDPLYGFYSAQATAYTYAHNQLALSLGIMDTQISYL